MPRIVTLPNGETVSVPDSMSKEEARLHIVRKFPQMFEREQGFMPAMKSGLNTGIAAVQKTGAETAREVGFSGVADVLDKWSTDRKEKDPVLFEPTVGADVKSSFENEGILSGVGAFKRQWITEPLGGVIGAYGPATAAGIAAGAVAGPVAGALTFLAPTTAMEAGHNLERQEQEGQPTDLVTATATGMAQAAIARFGLGKFIHGAAGQGIALREAAKLAPQVLAGKITKEAAEKQLGSTLRNVLVETGANAATGTAMMVGTEALRRGQAGQEIGSQGAFDEYGQMALGSAAMAPLFGGLHGARARGNAKGVIAREQQKVDDFKGAMEGQKAAEQADLELKQKTEAEEAAATAVATQLRVAEKNKLEGKDRTLDGVRRALDVNEQPGIMNPAKPLEMLPQADGRRDMARDAFEQNTPDLLGELRPEPVPDVRTPLRRAGEQPFELEPDAGQLPLPLGERRAAPDNPNPHLPSEDLFAPALTRRQQFDGMVSPRSPTYKNGLLDGKDLTKPEDVAALTKTLKKYLRNVADSERTAPQRDLLTKTIAELDAMHKPLKQAEPVAPIPDVIAKVPDGQKPADPSPVVPPLPKAKDVDIQADRSIPAANDGTSQPAMELRGARAAVPDRLPPAGGVGNAVAAGPAGADVLRAGKDGNALAAPDAPASVKSFDELGTLIAAKKNSDIGKQTDAAMTKLSAAQAKAAAKEARAAKQELGRANAEAARAVKLDARTNDELGVKKDPEFEAALAAETARVADVEQKAAFTAADDSTPLRTAVGTGDMGAVGSALTGSANPIISHVGQIAKNVKGVKVQEAADGAGPSYAPATRTVSLPKDKAGNEHAVAHETAHALTQTALDHPTPEQKPIVTKLRHLYEAVKGKLGKEYGVKDVHEFVAEGYSNPAFQKKLADIKYANTTAWGKFTEYVARLLKLKNDNALTEFLSLAEQLEGTGLKVKTDKDAAPLKLGTYADATIPETQKGVLETMVGGVRHLASGKVTRAGVRDNAATWRDQIEQGMFNIDHGVTRFLDLKWTRMLNGKLQATARALLQHAPYGIQLARESMTIGGVRKNAEGMWKIVYDANNFHTLNEAIDALPVAAGGNKHQAANGVLNNLLYFERETAAKGAGTDLPARPASVTDASIAQARKDFAAEPAVQKLVAIVKSINDQNIRTLEEGGVITKATAAEWRKKQHYVPMNRMMEDTTVPLGTLTHGGAGISRIHNFEGSERAVDDIMGNLIKQRLYAVDAAMRNNASAHAIKELQGVGGGGVTAHKQRPSAGNVVTVFEDGVQKFYTVDDAGAYRTFRGIENQTSGAFMNGMENITRMFREAIMLSPDAIFRGVVRDVEEAWAFNHSSKPLLGLTKDVVSQIGTSLPGVFREMVDGKVHRPRHDVMNFGVTGVREFTSLQREQQAIIRQHMKGANPNDWAAYADRGIAAAYHAWQGVAVEAELGTRNRVFKDVLARTGSETEAVMASINTLDFRRRGAWNGITTAKKLIPFFNSSLQGFYKLYRAIARNDNLGMDAESARKMLMIKGARMAIAAAAYQAVMSEDEDYMRLDKKMRDTNIMVPIGGGTFFKLAIPFEFGSMFWTVPANLVSTLNGDQSGRELNKALRGAVMHSMPGVIPQAVKPLIEVSTNYDFFTGRAIETAAQKRMEPGERVNSSTTDVAKTLAAGPVSPIMVDKILKGYFGSLGEFATAIVGAAIPDGAAAKPEKAWQKMPVIKSLVTDPTRSSYVDKFYELRDTTTKVKETVDKMLKEGRVEEAKQYLSKTGPTGVPNQVLYGLDKPMDGMAKKLGDARKMSKAIEADRSMSPEMKRAQLEQIRKATNTMIEQAMPSLRKASGE